MRWNFRVMRHAPTPESNEEFLAIHEVYYSDDHTEETEEQMAKLGYTSNPVSVTGESVESLRWTLTRMLEALDKPVLPYKEEE
ncbi:hypothetical protein SAMN05216409_12717 [Pseudomonas lutea]|uniref:Uncharacterized protein n=2 Tax=Pseudomonas TaxID=286 RepID=A0A9X8MHP7_9PSED|nr:hypothetical protein SAMN05216409_12717 [Pseudomonas lutea]